ncbi:MAG: hypothetical protein U0P30_04575 [Vicinamibacterales bacterium]
MNATLHEHQRDMRDGFAWGAPGMTVSGLVWLAAAAVAMRWSFMSAVLTLFAGGAVIHPLGMLLAKAVGRRGANAPGNPLAALALESTVWMLALLPIAFAVATREPRWFLPAMMSVIGGRYLVFQSIYGARIYWICGGALVAAAWALVALRVDPAIAAATGGLVELAFAAVLWGKSRG